jgi:signal transduction histidine kinase
VTAEATVRTAPPLSRLAERLPPALGSIRVRLTVLYSTLLFGLAAVVVGLIYLGLSTSLDDVPVSRRYEVTTTLDGRIIDAREVQVVPALELFERQVNRRAMEQLRTYSFSALGLLFIASLGVGWYGSGLVLRPIGRITRVAREIQATDLSRRINLRGPNDEIHQLADTFDEMLGRLDDAFESQRQFIHEASHELRNPIAVIRTNVDVALADPGATADDLRSTAAVVGRAAERMGTLVDDLLAHARLNARASRSERVDLGRMIDDAAAEFRASAAAKDIAIETDAPRGVVVNGDRVALQRAVANLLVNAIRESGPGTSIRLEAGREHGWAWFAVTDHGPGIPVEDRERVFQRFWRGDPGNARQEGRSGLGLTIVRQIAAAHNGRVTLRSEMGQGSTFALWLPAEPVSTGPEAIPGSEGRIGPAAPEGRPPEPPARALSRPFAADS